MKPGWPHIVLPLALAGCAGAEAPVAHAGATMPRIYAGIEATALDKALVEIRTAMYGAEGPGALRAYGDCAAAGYARNRGFGFVRHLRTATRQQRGRWTGQAVYTLSDTLPKGVRTIDAEVTVAACDENGIPTI